MVCVQDVTTAPVVPAVSQCCCPQTPQRQQTNTTPTYYPAALEVGSLKGCPCAPTQARQSSLRLLLEAPGGNPLPCLLQFPGASCTPQLRAPSPRFQAATAGGPFSCDITRTLYAKRHRCKNKQGKKRREPSYKNDCTQKHVYPSITYKVSSCNSTNTYILSTTTTKKSTNSF